LGLRRRRNAGHSVKLYSVYRPASYFHRVFIGQSPSLEEDDNLSPQPPPSIHGTRKLKALFTRIDIFPKRDGTGPHLPTLRLFKATC
jgi:hypothetical protein